MRRIINLILFVNLFLVAACSEEIWEQDELVDSPVWVAQSSSTPTQNFYCYSEAEYIIIEEGELLSKYSISDWSINEGVDVIQLSFKVKNEDKVELYNISYNNNTDSGILKISNLDGSLLSEIYLSSLEQQIKAIDKNY